MATEGFAGMGALIRGLGQIGDRVQAEAVPLVRFAAQFLRGDVAQQYPRRSGRLQDRVVAEQVSPLRWKVRSKAPHAWLYDHGSYGVRRLQSTGASRGVMPPPSREVFVPSAMRARARLVAELIRLVERQTVPGMTGRLEVRR